MMEELSSGEKEKERKSAKPTLEKWEWAVIIACYFIVACLIFYVIVQCMPSNHLPAPSETLIYKVFFKKNIHLSYSSFIVILILLFIIRYIMHEINETKCRRFDASKARAMFVEARTVEPRLTEENEKRRPEPYEKKVQELMLEIERLENLTERRWTEYEMLSLDQMLVDFLVVDDLIAQAKSRLTELGEYAEDSSFELEKRQYYNWEEQIKTAIDIIDEKRKKIECDKESPSLLDDCAERLRAVSRALIEAITDYEYNWGLGSAIMRALNIYGVQAIFLLLAMGLLPLYHPEGKNYLGLFNWGILGISGSISAVLLGLRRSNYVEVGYTLGKKEMWRAVLGAGLGLVAGILLYSMIAGGLLEGGIFPTLCDNLPSCGNTYLSIFWAIAAGFGFEKIFERVHSSVKYV